MWSGSNPVGVDPDVDGLMWIMSWSSNGATVWDDPTGCAVAGSILSAHFSQIKTFFSPIRSRPIPLVIVVGLDPLPVSLDGQDTRFSPWRPGFDSRDATIWIGADARSTDLSYQIAEMITACLPMPSPGSIPEWVHHDLDWGRRTL